MLYISYYDMSPPLSAFVQSESLGLLERFLFPIFENELAYDHPFLMSCVKKLMSPFYVFRSSRKIWIQYRGNLTKLNNGANIAKSNYREGYGLKKEVDEVVVLSVHIIIASTQEEEGSKYQLQHI